MNKFYSPTLILKFSFPGLGSTKQSSDNDNVGLSLGCFRNPVLMIIFILFIQELQKTVKKYEVEEKSSGGHMVMSPTAMSRQLASLQSTNLLLLDKQGQLKTNAHSLEDKLKEASSLSENMKEQLITEQQRASQRSDFIKRLQRKLLLVSKVN